MGFSAAASGSSQFILQESLGQTGQETPLLFHRFGTCDMPSWVAAKLGLWLGFLTPGPVSVYRVTLQCRVRTAMWPFLFRNGFCQVIGGLQDSNTPAFLSQRLSSVVLLALPG